MAVYNKGEYVKEAIDSVIGQSLDFKNNIQLILVNDKSTDNTLDILEDYRKKWPQNITLITNEKNMGSAFSRNQGLKHVQGEYVNFMDSDDVISKDAFEKAYHFLNENKNVDIVSIPIYFFGVKRGPHPLNFKYEKDQIVNVFENPEYIQLSGASAFFRFEKLKNYSFSENLRVSEDSLLINQMLLENPNIAFLSDPKYYYRKDGTLNSLIASSAFNKSYFTTRIDEYFIKLIEYSQKNGEIPLFIQYVLMYDLQWIVEIRKIDSLLDEDETEVLYDKIIEILSYIDERVILRQLSIPAALKAHLILMKRYGRDYLNGSADFYDDFKLNTVFIDNFDFLNDHEVKLEGILTDFTEDTEITACIDGRDFACDRLYYPQRDDYSLNFKYGFNHCFRVVLPFSDNSKITFKSQHARLGIQYSQTSRLNSTSAFKLSRNHIAVDGDNEIHIIKRKTSSLLKLELKTLKSMIGEKSQGWITGVALRILYYLTYIFLRNKRIWIFMDRPEAAGDNAFELFRYVNSIDSDAECYFVLDKSAQSDYDYNTSSRRGKLKHLFGLDKPSPQFARLKKTGNVLSNRSLKHRLYILFSEYIITSHPDNPIIYPFWGNYSYLSGLLKSKTVFLQHGVTKDDVSSWLNEFDKPLSMLCCVSDRERESFKNPDYGYSPDILKTVGFARFDRLEDKSVKEIVIMPSWRRNLDHLSPADFVKTEFYRAYNSLLNDVELIDFLKDAGYTMIFKPHQNLHKFADTFTKHPDVRFDLNPENYTETFNRASLMVTDFSSVAFDFAYIRKPVIYYHFDDDYHFDVENAYFSYENDGFGPVSKSPDELKSDIFKMIENDCQMLDIYLKRADEFFKYSDRNNSKRVYDAIRELDSYY